jgi:hypothetical protein
MGGYFNYKAVKMVVNLDVHVVMRIDILKFLIGIKVLISIISAVSIYGFF